MTHAAMLRDGTIMVKARLGDGGRGYQHRQLAVTLKPTDGALLFKVWGREERGGEKFHPYPGPAIDDFLCLSEHVVVAAGLDELAHCVVGLDMSSSLLEAALDAVSDILKCAQHPEAI